MASPFKGIERGDVLTVVFNEKKTGIPSQLPTKQGIQWNAHQFEFIDWITPLDSEERSGMLVSVIWGIQLGLCEIRQVIDLADLAMWGKVTRVVKTREELNRDMADAKPSLIRAPANALPPDAKIQ